ncbi:RHS repeat-associated core domain-containing protein, partial [Bosea psychrotolerans]
DHLDRPIRMTNASQALVWDAVYKPYGEVVSITGAATLDARFPGQWFQLETGLQYNWHRTYDPTTGRYLQTDPLGNVDGPSVYAYASGSPQMRTDREGLAGPAIAIPAYCAANPAACAALGAGVYTGVKQIVDFCRRSFGGGGEGGRRNDPPKDQCDQQKEADDQVCRSLSSPAMKARCWASAADRYADCLSGRSPRPFRYGG